VSQDAVGELPADVAPIIRRAADGVRRAGQGLTYSGDPDLFHGLDVDLPLRSRFPTVSTVHDLAVFDVPWAFPRHRAIGERLLVERSIRSADALVAVSEFTAERLWQRFRREATITHLASSGVFHQASRKQVAEIRSRLSLPGNFVLHIGTIEPRKDVHTLAAACVQARVPLVLAGSLAYGESLPASAIHLGRLPSPDLASLIGAAIVVAYTSSYEGFGLPVIEAAACGATLMATNIPAVQEVLGDAVVVVRRGREVEMAKELAELVGDRERRVMLRDKALEAVKKLSWARTARATLEAYSKLGFTFDAAPDSIAVPPVVSSGGRNGRASLAS
jgi:glycosyltransferase involved in cell wall biosynthesis